MPKNKKKFITAQMFDVRPVDETGRIVLENVRAAGSILAHHQAIEEKSREGIDIATGFLAVKRALAS